MVQVWALWAPVIFACTCMALLSSHLEGTDPALRGVGRDDLSAVLSTGPFVVQLRQNYDRYGHHALSPGRFTYCTYADSKGLLPGGEEIVMSHVFFQSVSRDVPETAGMFGNTSSSNYNAVLLVRYLGYASSGRDSSNMTVEVTVYQDHVNSNKVTTMPACSHIWPQSGCTYASGDIAVGITVPFKRWWVSSPIILYLRIFDENDRLLSCTMTSIAEVSRLRPSMSALRLSIFFLMVRLLAFEVIARVSTARTLLRRTLQRRNIQQSLWKVRPGSAMLLALSGHQLLRFPVLRRFCLPGFSYFLHQIQYLGAMVMVPIHAPEVLIFQSQWTTWAMLMGFVGAPMSILGHFQSPTYANTPFPAAPFGQAFHYDVASPLGMLNVPNYIVNFNSPLYGLAAYAHDTGLSAADLVWCCLVSSMVIIGTILVFSAVAYGISLHKRPSPEAIKRIGTALPTEAPHSTHLAMLHGNLLRFVYFFHLPITISVWYGLVGVPPSYRTFFYVVFLLIVIFVPFHALWKIWNAPARLLYQDKLFFLRYGPLYNTYRPGAHRYAAAVFAHSFVFGTIVGTSQMNDKVGAIAAVILELFFGILSTLYLPWDANGMGPLNLYICALRFVSALSLLLGSSLLQFRWLTRIRIGFMPALMQIFFGISLLVLTYTRLFELLFRLYSGACFDQTTPEKDSGLSGAIRSVYRRTRGLPVRSMPTKEFTNVRPPYAASITSSFNSLDMWRVHVPRGAGRWEGIAWLQNMLRRKNRSHSEQMTFGDMREPSMSHVSLGTQTSNESMYWLELSSAASTAPEPEQEQRVSSDISGTSCKSQVHTI